MKAQALAAASDGAKAAAGAPFVVGSRSRPIVLFALAGAGVVALMVLVRRGGDLDFDDEVMSALTLVLGGWLAAQACGLLARRMAAGYAMRLDGEGLHHPGWRVVPWPALRDVRLRRLGGSGTRSYFHLVLDIDPACDAPTHGSYVRWLFGPVEGLWRRRGAIEIPLVALDVESQKLFGLVEAAWRAGRHRSSG